MTAITIKNLPPGLYERLKELAQVNRRSLNREIIACLEQTVFSQPIEVEEHLRQARKLRELTAAYQIADEAFRQAKESGRP
ncbi:MAG: Arc family DNA-binding protein [Anaerolineales bacterium]|jgi:plasmid stability protein|nr:Arc family DNA-binding protein [Anaerolineales bacterium]